MNKKYFLTSHAMRIIAVSTAALTVCACGKKPETQNQMTQGLSMSSASSSNACAATSQASYSNSSGAMCASAASSSSSYSYYTPAPIYSELDWNTEEYSDIDENIFKEVATSPLSTFSADVDTASYANVRRMLKAGHDPKGFPKGSIRAEEMINYFSYDYTAPGDGEIFGVEAEISECPWNADNKLLRIGIQTDEADFKQSGDSNIVLLIDVSGSMGYEDKLPLVKDSVKLMLNNLGNKDRVSIVTYASGVNVVLDGKKGSQKRDIINALDALEAKGGTQGEGGIEEAYTLAEKYFIEGGNNRVIIFSDGDFNIGRTSASELSDLVKEKAESGVYLTVLGYGTGNYSDVRMETLADDGNGNYSYIDSITEAKKVLVDEFGATMITVAKDVKFQVEFNPCYVSDYRLIGYENRAMANEEFNDDKKDAGEIGAGHSVTVLYEIVPANEDKENNLSLKYQKTEPTDEALNSNEWLTLSIRYKEPDSDTSILKQYNIGDKCYNDNPSDDFKFAAAVAEFSMILRDSEYIGDGSLEHVSKTLKKTKLDDDYKKEFADLVKKSLEY